MFQKCLAPKKILWFLTKITGLLSGKSDWENEEHVSKIVASSKKMRKTHNTKKEMAGFGLSTNFHSKGQHLERHNMVKVFYSPSFLCDDKPIAIEVSWLLLKKSKGHPAVPTNSKMQFHEAEFSPLLGHHGTGRYGRSNHQHSLKENSRTEQKKADSHGSEKGCQNVTVCSPRENDS